MVYLDPYVYDPDKQTAELRRMVFASLLFHGAILAAVITFAGSRLFESERPIDPPKVYEVSLIAAVPKEKPRSLPDKVTSAPPPPPAEEVVSVKEPEEAPPPEKPPEKQPEKQPEDLNKTLERLASLRNRLKTQPAQTTPIPGAADGPRNRPNEADEASSGTKSALVSYKPDSPEGRYLGAIRAAVVNAWIVNQRLKKEQPDLKVVIQVTIGSDGRLVLSPSSDVAIVQSSGNISFDQSALRAVKMVATQQRFPDPPGELNGEVANLGFTAQEGQ